MKETKKIIFNFDSLHDFSDYGIQIPLLNERVIKTIESLQSKYDFAESKYRKIKKEDLLLAHSDQYIEKTEQYPDEVVKRTYELVNSDGSLNRYDPINAKKPLIDFIDKAKIHIAGTYQSALNALTEDFSYHLGGGMHHAMSFGPSGFCMFNDLVITSRMLQKENKVKKVLIIDLDCHKGDGTAEITSTDSSITSFSIHMKKGWPLSGEEYDECGKLNPSFIKSSVDIPVENSRNYMDKLRVGLDKVLADKFDLALIVHGVDVFEGDALESSNLIKLSKEEVLSRDLLVFNRLKDLKLPQSWCLGGGYGLETSSLYVQFLEKAL